MSRSVSDESALAERDQLLEPVQLDLVRQLKRVLQDEQNEVLDRLRRTESLSADIVLLPLDEHVERYQAAATPLLAQAAGRGAAFASPADAGSVPGHEWPAEQWAADLAVDLVVPLRERLVRVFEEAAGSDEAQRSGALADVAGVSERLGTGYRQWKTSQIEQAARHHASAAFTIGAYAATPDGTELCWVVDDDGGPCPDCDDNALAGGVVKGEPFPTGQFHPPAHGGCRCILVTSAT